MSDAKPGEKVSMTLNQENKDGELLWDMQSSWYGFDNAQANTFVNGLVKTIAEYTQNLSDIKNA